MSFLIAILIILSILKLVFAYTLSKFEIQDVSTIFPCNPEELKYQIVGFLILDGLVGIFCGVYLLLL